MIGKIVELIKTLKDISIKKIMVIFICIYPLFTVVYFKNELMLMFKPSVEMVELENVGDIIRETNNLKDNFRASFVSVWLYQPSGHNKFFKERISYSGDSRNLMYDLSKVQLIHHPSLLNALRNNKYVRIFDDSSFELSKLVNAYDINVIYVIPLKNDYGLITSEIMIGLDYEPNEKQLKKIINSTELIRLKM